jgi:periplasmic protein TonB
MRSKKLVGKDSDYPANTTTALGRCLVDADPEAGSVNRRRRNKMFGMSLAIEIAFLILLVVVPMLSSVAQPPVRQNLPATVTFFGRYSAHPAVIQEVRRTTNPRPAIPNPFPQWIAASVGASNRSNEVVEAIFSSDEADYLPGAMEGMELSRTSLLVEPPHVAPPEAPPEKHPVKISEGVLQAQLISRIDPRYPDFARSTKIDGTVRLRAVISRDGRIESLEVVNGHPLLVKAALDAVRQWRYRPTILNGEPVEVETSITVVFQLRQ